MFLGRVTQSALLLKTFLLKILLKFFFSLSEPISTNNHQRVKESIPKEEGMNVCD